LEVQRDGAGGVDGLNGATWVAVSPDGGHVYAAGQWDDAVAVFARDGASGGLTFLEVQRDGAGGVDGLNGATSVALSPDGSHVYVTGFDDDAVAVFSRNATTGGLTFVEVQRDNAGAVDALDGATSVALSPDGNHVYVTGAGDEALAVFSRDGSTGRLTFVEALGDETGIADLDDPQSVTVSPDGEHVYVASYDDDGYGDDGDDDDYGEYTLVRVYEGKSPSPENLLFEGMLQPYDIFSFAGIRSDGTMGTEIGVFVTDDWDDDDDDESVLNTIIHTSCSQPIGPGLVGGAFEVVEGYSKYGGRLCPLGGTLMSSSLEPRKLQVLPIWWYTVGS
jgi:hypothetical protein